MQLFRRVIAVLLMISLPAYGWAFSAMPTCSIVPTCSMQHGQKSVGKVVAAEAGSHTCCAEHGAKSFAHGDSQCQCGALYQAVQPLTAPIIPPTHNIIQSSTFPSITTIALPLWRPPTLS